LIKYRRRVNRCIREVIFRELSAEKRFQATDAKHAAVLRPCHIPDLIGHHVVLVEMEGILAAVATVEAVTFSKAIREFNRARFIYIIGTLVAHELTVTLKLYYVKSVWKRVPHPATFN